jgi:hypothetical protein
VIQRNGSSSSPAVDSRFFCGFVLDAGTIGLTDEPSGDGSSDGAGSSSGADVVAAGVLGAGGDGVTRELLARRVGALIRQ